MWLINKISNSSNQHSHHHVQNNQIGLPDLVLKHIIILLQSSTTHYCNERSDSQDLTQELTIFHRKDINQQSNYLYLSLVCSYWYKRIIPYTIKRFRYVLHNTENKDLYLISSSNPFDKMLMRLSNLNLKYKRSPLQLYNQSLLKNQQNNNNDNNNNFNIETLKIYLPTFVGRGRTSSFDYRDQVNRLEDVMNFESSLCALPNLRNLTLYNVIVDEHLLNLSIHCKQLERLVIYPSPDSVWNSRQNTILFSLLHRIPSIHDLAIKTFSVNLGIPPVGDLSCLEQITKFTYIGETKSNQVGLISDVHLFSRLSNLRHLNLKITKWSQTSDNMWLQSLPNKDKLETLHLGHFVSPKLDCLAKFTNLSRLYIEGANQLFLFEQPTQMAALHDQISLLKNLTLLSIKLTLEDSLHSRTLIKTIDSLPLLRHLKLASLVVGNRIQDLLLIEPVLRYLESNHTIKRFSYSITSPKFASVFNKTFNQDGHNNPNFTPCTLNNDNLTQKSLDSLQQSLISLIRNSQALEVISLSSNVGFNPFNQVPKLRNNPALISSSFVMSIMSLNDINPSSCLSIIKIDKCLSKLGIRQDKSQHPVIMPKKKVHEYDLFKWEVARRLKQNVNTIQDQDEAGLDTILEALSQISTHQEVV